MAIKKRKLKVSKSKSSRLLKLLEETAPLDRDKSNSINSYSLSEELVLFN